MARLCVVEIWCYSGRVSDPDIERLEDEIYQSRIKPWDVESFLAERHRKKFEALSEPVNPENPWPRRWLVAKDIGTAVLAFIGYLTVGTLAGMWLLTGRIVPLLW